MPPQVHVRPALPADVPVCRALIEASARALQAHDYTAAQIEGALDSVFGVDTQLIADGTYFVVVADPAAKDFPRGGDTAPEATSPQSPEAAPACPGTAAAGKCVYTENPTAADRPVRRGGSMPPLIVACGGWPVRRGGSMPPLIVACGGWPVRRGGNMPPLIVGCGGWSKRKTLYGGDRWTAREDSLLDPLHDAAKIRAFFIHPGWARRGIGTLLLDTCEAAARSAGFARFEMGATLTGAKLFRAKGYAPIENLDVPLPNGLSLPVIRMFKRNSRY